MENKQYIYKAQIIDEEENEVVATIEALSEESLLEEMGKSKWTNAIQKHEDEIQKELEMDIEAEHAEDLKADGLMVQKDLEKDDEDCDRTASDYEQSMSEEEMEGDMPR